MATPENMTIGACTVTWKGVDRGLTLGGVTVEYAPEYADILADLWGNTPYDKRLMGEIVTVTVQLAEWDIDVSLDAAMPIAGTEGASARTFGSQAGKSLRTEAGELVLHPIHLGAGDLSQNFGLYVAVVHDTVSLNRQNDTQFGVEVTFLGLIDNSKSDGNLLGYIGDSTTLP